MVLALAYVLPNHYYPWTSFHAEALAAFAALMPVLWLALKGADALELAPDSLLVLLAILVALLQYAAGLISYWGTAWVVLGYLLGLLVSLQFGAIWERYFPGQCLDYLAQAFVIAAVISLPMQWMQWLGLSWETPFIMNAPDYRRPFANMAQPNLLGDLHLLAVLGLSWLHGRKRISGMFGTVLAACFLLGAAMTGSRASWINVLFLMGFSTLHAPSQSPRAWRRIVVALGLFFFVCANVAPWIQSQMLGDMDMDTLRQFSTGSSKSRLAVWKMMGLASLQSPWWGYGWGQVVKVNFVFEEAMGVERGLFNQSHNILLDLMLWNGYLLGTLFFVGLVWWVWRVLALEKNGANWHRQACIMVLCLHCMVEFPIYYTYFLLPLGLLLGSLQAQIWPRGGLSLHRHWRWLMLGVGCIMLYVSVHDYFIIERNYYALRFETRGYQTTEPKEPPKGWALTQLVEFLKVSRQVDRSGYTPAEFQQMEEAVRVTPGGHTMFKIALAYGLAGDAQRATFWLRQICDKLLQDQCAIAKFNWNAAIARHSDEPLMAWPLP